MLELHHREGCPHSIKVRKLLERHGLPFKSLNAPKLGSERKALLGLEGTTSSEVPVLVDGDTVVQGSDAIIEYIEAHHVSGFFADPSYGLTRKLPGVSYADAVAAVKEELQKEGFGVLTEIDVRATLEKKIGVDFRPYVILGACNPPLAHQALTAEPAVGLLLPCNVVVTQEDDGSAVVSAIDPRKMFSVVDNPAVKPLATDVGARLRRVLAALPSEP